jgi:uracil phosphoribosyltransferase
MRPKRELLSILRDRNLATLAFRKTTRELVDSLAAEHRTTKEAVLVPILRSGLAMLSPFLAVFPNAPIGVLGLFRDEKTLKPHLHYKNLPPLHRGQTIFLLDPMLATGGSIDLAIQLLLKGGAVEEQIVVIALIGSKVGLQTIKKKHPGVRIECVAVDEDLDASGYIVPGLGDFGDRFFGTYKREKP